MKYQEPPLLVGESSSREETPEPQSRCATPGSAKRGVPEEFFNHVRTEFQSCDTGSGFGRQELIKFFEHLDLQEASGLPGFMLYVTGVILHFLTKLKISEKEQTAMKRPAAQSEAAGKSSKSLINRHRHVQDGRKRLNEDPGESTRAMPKDIDMGIGITTSSLQQNESRSLMVYEGVKQTTYSGLLFLRAFLASGVAALLIHAAWAHVTDPADRLLPS
ncbi:hypothetical protein CYMTET_12541 [Cymbomonas tetramitiformis]|uniref:Uncharacterized protein n=1 Tax=Cymbomonas tetramitiformis TaxID=36881 RepID=A0AAE0GK75_9CHLO|nr:hypothetical protein CYMTET_12541 [Cymbomonas tetramitiformis]